MHPYCDDFIQFIQDENKEEAFKFIMEKLESGSTNIVELYSQILAPTLNQIMYKYEDHDLRIFEEHIYTGIVLSIIEASYPHVLKESKKYTKINKSVMVICPSKEYHIIGARMVADFFTILGFTTTFVGNDTPENVILAAINEKKPDFVAMSVTNPYHLVPTKRVIMSIRETGPSNLKIILGGHAVIKQEKSRESLGADYILNNFGEIKSLRESIENGGENK